MAVVRARFSPDCKLVLTASDDHTARLLTTIGLIPAATLTGHTDTVWDAQFVTASADKSAQLWDAADGHFLAALNEHTASVDHAEFSPDNKQIIRAGDDEAARIWNSTAPGVLFSFGDQTRVLLPGNFFPGWPAAVDWQLSNGNSRILSVPDGPQEILLQINIGNPVWSPNSKQILAGQTVLDASTGKPLFELTGHTSSVFHTEFSPDKFPGSPPVVLASREAIYPQSPVH